MDKRKVISEEMRNKTSVLAILIMMAIIISGDVLISVTCYMIGLPIVYIIAGNLLWTAFNALDMFKFLFFVYLQSGD